MANINLDEAVDKFYESYCIHLAPHPIKENETKAPNKVKENLCSKIVTNQVIIFPKEGYEIESIVHIRGKPKFEFEMATLFDFKGHEGVSVMYDETKYIIFKKNYNE